MTHPAAAEPTGAEVLTSAVRRSIADLLANLPHEVTEGGGSRTGLSAAQVGERLGMHVTTARFHLDLMVRAGILSSELRRSGRAGRPRKLYTLTPGSLDPAPQDRAYRALAELLATAFLPSPDGTAVTPEEAGRRWVEQRHRGSTPPPAATSVGEWFGKVGHAVDQLHEWGYTPQVRTEDAGRTAYLTLVDCPFLDLARTNPQVVCGVHRGLLRGTLDALGEPDVEVGLEPFVTPTTCLARIATPHPLSSPPRAEHPGE